MEEVLIFIWELIRCLLMIVGCHILGAVFIFLKYLLPLMILSLLWEKTGNIRESYRAFSANNPDDKYYEAGGNEDSRDSGQPYEHFHHKEEPEITHDLYMAYIILDLKPGASIREVKEAYRKNALLFHPDKNQSSSPQERMDAENTMKEINAAYTLIMENINVSG